MSDPFLARTLEALARPTSSYAKVFDTSPALDLGVGEVRYPMPPEVGAEIAATVAEMDRIWYSSPIGEADLRRAFLRSRTDAADTVDQVLITAGGKEAAWLAVRYLLQFIDHPLVLTPGPGWEPYTLWLHAAGCRGVRYDPAALAADPESLHEIVATAPKPPGLLIINYPHNPTGVGIDQPGMDALVAIAADLGLRIVSDEVYRAFAETAASAMLAPAFDPSRHLVVDSCSKWLATAGLRVGFLHADTGTIANLTGFRATYASHTSQVTQAVALTLLTHPAAKTWLDSVRAQVIGSRDVLATALAARGVQVDSVGGLYVWCRRPAAGTLPPVNAVPARLMAGDGFGAPGHVRICAARSGLDPQTAADAVVATLRGV